MQSIGSIADKFADIPEETLSELPDLTDNQHKFVMALIGDSALTASDAFRKAYDTSNWSDEAIWVQASRLKAHPKVKLWLDAVRALQLKTGQVTLNSHLSDLEGLAARAEQSGNYGAAVNAKVSQGRAAGLYKDKIEMSQADPKALADEVAYVVKSWAEAHNVKVSDAELVPWIEKFIELTP